MDKPIIVVLAILAVAALGFTFTLVSHNQVETSTYVADLNDYDQRIASTLGLEPSEDMSYILSRPLLPELEHAFDPSEKISYLVYLKGDSGKLSNRNVVKAYKKLMQDDYPLYFIYGCKDDYWIIANDNINVTVFYDQLVVGALLVGPGGNPLSVEDFQRVNQDAEKLAAEFGLTVEYKETVTEAANRAKELSSFYHEYDQWVVLGVEAGLDNQYKGKELHDVLSSLGLKWGEYNNYYWYNYDQYIGSNKLLSVANNDPEGNGDFIPEEMVKEDYTTPGIVIGFYLPTCGDPIVVFDNVLLAAQYVKNCLGGTITNAEGMELKYDDIKRIKQVVADMTQEMTDYGITPGYAPSLWLYR